MPTTSTFLTCGAVTFPIALMLGLFAAGGDPVATKAVLLGVPCAVVGFTAVFAIGFKVLGRFIPE